MPIKQHATPLITVTTMNKFLHKLPIKSVLPILVLLIGYGISMAIMASQVFTPFFPDFDAFYWAAQATFNEQRSPYDKHVLGALADRPVFPFIYPPIALPAFYPLTLFSYELAYALNFFSNALCLMVSLLLCLRTVLGRPLQWQDINWRFSAFSLLCFWALPSRLSLANGQINLIILGLATTCWWLQTQRTPQRASMILAVASAIKVYPALLNLNWLITGAVRPLLSFIATIALMTGVAYIAIPTSAWHDWWQHYAHASAYNQGVHQLNFSFLSNQSLNGLLQKMQWVFKPSAFTVTVMTIVSYGIALSILISSLVTIRKVHARNTKHSALIAMPLLLLNILLIAPLTWSHHAVLAIPLMFVFVHPNADLWKNRTPFSNILFFSGLIIWFYEFKYDPQTSTAWQHVFIGHNTLYGVLLMWLAVMLGLSNWGKQHVKN